MSSLRPATSAASRWPIVCVVAVALLAMGRACGFEWSNFDDDLFLYGNPRLNPPTFASFGAYVFEPFRGLWTPATNAIWWLVAWPARLDVPADDGSRLNPWFFHGLNVLLHALNAALAFVVVRRVARPAPAWAAAMGAMLFAAHPVQIEAVAWPCGTKDVLAATFALASIVAIARDPAKAKHAAISIAFAALAMLAKPSAAALPAMLAIVAWTLGKPTRATWIAIAGSAALAVPTVIVARAVQLVGDVPAVPPIARPIVALDALAFHLAHLSWPIDLCVDYGLRSDLLLASPRRFWTWLAPCAVVAAVLVVARVRCDRAIVGGAALFVVALAPNLGLATFQFQSFSTVADHYAYLALIGIAIVGARLLDRAPKPAVVVAGLVVAALTILSVIRVGDWRDPSTLWARVLAVNPRSGAAHNNLATQLRAAGDLRGAIAHFETAADGGPATAFALLNLAQTYTRLGDADAAAGAAIRLVHVYRATSTYDAALERATVDRLARDIAAVDPDAAARLRRAASR